MAAWIKWDGGEPPVSDGTLVEVKLRDPKVVCDRIANAQFYGWQHGDDDEPEFDIVAYRIFPCPTTEEHTMPRCDEIEELITGSDHPTVAEFITELEQLPPTARLQFEPTVENFRCYIIEPPVEPRVPLKPCEVLDEGTWVPAMTTGILRTDSFDVAWVDADGEIMNRFMLPKYVRFPGEDATK